MTPLVRALIAVLVVALVGVGTFYYRASHTPRGGPQAATTTPSTPEQGTGDVTLAFGEEATREGVVLKPLTLVEDSRCPTDVQCIQAGRVRVTVTITDTSGSHEETMLVGEPIVVGTHTVVLLSVLPSKVSTQTLVQDQYRFTFRVETVPVTYVHASADLVNVELPTPGAVVGKQFTVKGEARGPWFFEASFPIRLVSSTGTTLVTVVAQATGDWMTQSFVPFTATLTVPDSYTGQATLVLVKDNPSGDPSKDASLSFPITVEY